jgi:D-alanyl-D-alanine carboxypeptidase
MKENGRHEATDQNHSLDHRRDDGALAAGIVLLGILNRPLSAEEFDAAVEKRLADAVATTDGVSSVLLTVADGRTGEVHEYAEGTTRAGGEEPARVDSPFHSASVGKTMLAAIYGQVVDEGEVSFDDPVGRWLDAETLDGLFVVSGVDHSADVTLGQLLSHTSGVGDYFEGPVTSGKTMLERIADDPDLRFTPADLIAFTREHQTPVGTPGETFSYSDTGYILLGLALERIEGEPYAQILDDRIFTPLGMADSRLMSEFGPGSGILAVDAHGVDLSERNALSVDRSGGGVVTMSDLLRFSRALEGGDLVSPACTRS